MVRLGEVRLGKEIKGGFTAPSYIRGMARPGEVRLGLARLGMAWYGKEIKGAVKPLFIFM